MGDMTEDARDREEDSDGALEPGMAVDDSGHDFQPFELRGQSRSRMRCRVCRRFKEQAPRRCPGPPEAPPQEPLEAVSDAVARVEDDRLRHALVNLIAGFHNRDGEGTAWEAGQVIAGHSKGDPAFYPKLVYLVEEAKAIQIQHSGDRFEIVAKGVRKASETNLQRAVHVMHDSMRPACPNCGSKDYKTLYGKLRHRFEPTDCNLCRPR